MIPDPILRCEVPGRAKVEPAEALASHLALGELVDVLLETGGGVELLVLGLVLRVGLGVGGGGVGGVRLEAGVDAAGVAAAEGLGL